MTTEHDDAPGHISHEDARREEAAGWPHYPAREPTAADWARLGLRVEAVDPNEDDDGPLDEGDL